ncbi:endolytic transglycosylase MltG [Modestobacter roseus]|nr:endolytic transglycosylase MltG [Modestobacter roseus]
MESDDQHPDDVPHDGTGGLDVLGGGGSGGGGRGRRGGSSRGGGAPSGRRRPVTIVLSLLVLGGLVAGIVFGGQALWRTLNPASEDYTGAGTGAVEVRVNQGDSLRAIAGALESAGVIASTGPFLEAAEADSSATGIQPGVYAMREQMSGAAALDLMLHPETRMVTKVTLREGLTVTQTLAQLAEATGIPLAEWEAAAADPAALGLPAYAGGMLEGFLFPATYDVTPDDTPTSVLSAMITRADQVLTQLNVPAERRLEVVTKASLVQAEAGNVTDMGMVARVLENRLADGMALQLDTTVNYANGKSGITTTAEDRANPSPYNTYANPGLPPGAISNPGEDAIAAVLNPTPGDWRYFVVVDPDTGETRFAVTGQEHQQNVLLFQQWLRDNPGN